MVEACCRRMLLEPVQKTQSPDIIVFQNGVLHLREEDPLRAFEFDGDAPLKHSHAVWVYFNQDVWNALVEAKTHLIGEDGSGGDNSGKGYAGRLRSICRAVAPIWAGYMEEWFPSDKWAFDVVLRWFGYSMTTDTRQNKFCFFYGPTRAGKGSLARLLCGIVGKNNYSAANYSAFEDKFQALGMHDKLVVTMEEVEATPKEHEKRLGMLKKYLGGERIVWEQKYERAFEDVFIGKLIMQANEVLAYEDKGRSVTARMIPVEFRESFEGAGEDPPEQIIFKGDGCGRGGEGNVVGTLAAMAWYRMCRNRVGGAFDFGDSQWTLSKCKACKFGQGSLLLESHKVCFPFLKFFDGINDGRKAEILEKKAAIKKDNFLICTSSRLCMLTEQVLKIVGKRSEVGNMQRLIKKAIAREFPESREKCFQLKDLGRARGWEGLYIDVDAVKREYPEVAEMTDEYDGEMHKAFTRRYK